MQIQGNNFYKIEEAFKNKKADSKVGFLGRCYS
jgi:hypothetical protein